MVGAGVCSVVEGCCCWLRAVCRASGRVAQPGPMKDETSRPLCLTRDGARARPAHRLTPVSAAAVVGGHKTTAGAALATAPTGNFSCHLPFPADAQAAGKDCRGAGGARGAGGGGAGAV